MNFGPLAITADNLKRLSPSAVVDFLRELLWAEATRVGIGKNLIDVPSAITVGDGGVDAQATGVPAGVSQGILKEGRTFYQVKAGNFSLRKASNVNDILFVKGQNKKKKELHPRVKTCFDQGGTLVVVLFGWDSPDPIDDAARMKLVTALTDFDPAYASAKIEVWRPNQIVGFLKPFPSLQLSLLGGRQFGFMTHGEWSGLEDMKLRLVAGAGQERFIEQVRKALRESDGPVHLRVIGDPGIGKTRLVLESTSAEDLKALTLYFESPQNLWNSQIINHILLPDNVTNAILVVDECDADSRANLWNHLRSASPQIKLVTIYSEPDPTTGTTNYLYPDSLGDTEVAEILRSYGVPPDQTSRWVPLCSGSPRVAHIFGLNLQSNPEDPLQEPDYVRAWNRFIAGKDRLDTPLFDRRKNILMYLALFRRFGYGSPYQVEGRQVARKLRQMMGIQEDEFRKIIAELQSRKLLQGRTTLYITPRAFHIWLWTQWWNMNAQSGQFNLDEFLTVGDGEEPATLTGELLDSFLDMFRYARDSQAASVLVSRLLGADGVFTVEFLNTERGSRFFWRLAEADPPGALACLNRTLGYLTREQLLAIGPGRRNLVWALQGLAVWRDQFADAARHLLALGEAENEDWGNNASGVFAELFSLGPGKVAPTEASPAERLIVLQEALTSPSRLRQELGLSACEAGLQTHDFVRVMGPERQGLRREPELWKPRTWGELYDAYRSVWNSLYGVLEHLEPDERTKAVGILLDKARQLTQHPALARMVIETLVALIEQGYVSPNEVLKEAEEILYFATQLPDDVRSQWVTLRDRLTGTTFAELLRRYVGLDLLTDRVDENRQSTDKAKPKIEQLAQDAVADTSLLVPELGWLMTAEAQNGYAFGYALGERDSGFTLLPTLITALLAAGDNGTAYTLGGYLRALREQDEARWENKLDSLSTDPNTVGWVPDLTWRSGSLTDRAANRLLDLARSGQVRIEQMRMFAYGSSIATLSERAFGEWLSFLLETGTGEALSLALNLADFYYLRSREQRHLPELPTLSLLTHPALFDTEHGYRYDTMSELYWSELGKQFVLQHPGHRLEIAALLIEHIADDATIAGGYQPQSRAVLDEVTRADPAGVWTLARQYLDDPFFDARTYQIHHWLRGERFFGPYGSDNFDLIAAASSNSNLVPANLLWDWVDEAPERRARIAASIVPAILYSGDGEPGLAHQLLVRYGDRDDVRAGLSANYFSHSWSGPSSLHFADLRQQLLTTRKSEQNTNVRRWIHEQVSTLDRAIEQALADEERQASPI